MSQDETNDNGGAPVEDQKPIDPPPTTDQGDGASTDPPAEDEKESA